jgi:hypothetical protein
MVGYVSSTILIIAVLEHRKAIRSNRSFEISRCGLEEGLGRGGRFGYIIVDLVVFGFVVFGFVFVIFGFVVFGAIFTGNNILSMSTSMATLAKKILYGPPLPRRFFTDGTR